MPVLVVPDVCRFSVHQSLGGQEVVNIIDMQVDTTGSEVSRSEALFDVAGDILNNWNDHILGGQINDLQAVSVDWIDLNSENGPTGSRSTTSANQWPKAGSDAGSSIMPGMVALRIDKQTAGGRGTKKGRMYLAGVHEDATPSADSQRWDPGYTSGWTGRVTDLLEGINDQDLGGIPLAVSRQMVVVHAKLGTYSEVTGLSANPYIATQVRRGSLR